MNILRDIEPQRLPPTCLAVGVFDGVHVGHQAVLRQAVAGAREARLLAAALTFDPHPARALQPRRAPLLLTTMPERAALIAELGIEVLVIVKFDRAFANQTPEEFARCVLAQRLNARCVVAGEGFAFGRGASGNIAELGEKLGFYASAVKRVTVDGAEVSSTMVRELISAGEIERASALLGHYYVITGPVAPGDRRGRNLGFPTANIRVGRDKLLPPNGVYAVRAHIEGDAEKAGACPGPSQRGHPRHLPRAGTAANAQGQSRGESAAARAGGAATAHSGFGAALPAVANIGVRPTFGRSGARRAAQQAWVEAYMIGADPGDLYGRTITLEVVSRLRDEKRFATAKALVEQIQRDVARAQEILSHRV